MVTEFRFPDVGEGITEGELLKWLVSEGDLVKQDRAICEVETDKAVVELPSPVSGTILKLYVSAGTKIKVGQVLCAIGQKGETAPPVSSVDTKTVAAKSEAVLASKPTAAGLVVEKPSPSSFVVKKAETTAMLERPREKTTIKFAVEEKAPKIKIAESVAKSQAGFVKALPHTRQLARTLNIDISKIVGTGSGGKITDEDVKAAAENKTVPSVVMAVPKAGGAVSEEKHGLEERIPLRGIRKTIADKLSNAYRTAVHVSTMDETEVSELVRVREKEKKVAQAHGIHLTFLPFIIKACVVALQKYPIFNASLDDETNEIVLKHYYHIGIAVDTEDGLMVPVIKNADQKSMFELAIEIQELAKAARERKVLLDDLRGSSFSITNYGSVGAQYGTPIINPPNVAILGVGKIVSKPVVRNGAVVAGLVLPLTFTFDHRVADGAQAAAFLNTVLSLLADPDELLVETR